MNYPESPQSGHVFWLFGLSGSGKTTLALRLSARLRSANFSLLPLDGDILRKGLCRGLRFTDDDRTENLRRAAEVAKLGADSGLCVVAAFITPQNSQRALVADIIGRDRLSLIFVDAPLDICRARDVKGLYAAAAAGQIAQMTGVSADFETPTAVDLVLNTAGQSVTESAVELEAFARARLARPA